MKLLCFDWIERIGTLGVRQGQFTETVRLGLERYHIFVYEANVVKLIFILESFWFRNETSAGQSTFVYQELASHQIMYRKTPRPL